MTKEAIAFGVCMLFAGVFVARWAKTDGGFRFVAGLAAVGGFAGMVFVIAWDGAIKEALQLAYDLDISNQELHSALSDKSWGRFVFAPFFIGFLGLFFYVFTEEGVEGVAGGPADHLAGATAKISFEQESVPADAVTSGANGRPKADA